MSKEIRLLAQQHSAEAIEVLVKLMRNEKASPAARSAAAAQILDRAIGRPESSVNAQIHQTGTGTQYDLSLLTDDELAELERLEAARQPLLAKIRVPSNGS